MLRACARLSLGAACGSCSMIANDMQNSHSAAHDRFIVPNRRPYPHVTLCLACSGYGCLGRLLVNHSHYLDDARLLCVVPFRALAPISRQSPN